MQSLGRNLVVATHNAHKTAEIRQIVGSHFDEVVDLTEFPEVEPAIEDGDTFEANARIKALHGSRYCPDAIVLADDSGIEADALGRAPGIFSARYAGEGATDAENRVKLLKNLEGAENRAGRFRCVLALAQNGEIRETFAGVIEGTIIDHEAGEGGFGYDPIFIPEGHNQTFGLLLSEVKNGISHRARALQKLLVYLESA